MSNIRFKCIYFYLAIHQLQCNACFPLWSELHEAISFGFGCHMVTNNFNCWQNKLSSVQHAFRGVEKAETTSNKDICSIIYSHINIHHLQSQAWNVVDVDLGGTVSLSTLSGISPKTESWWVTFNNITMRSKSVFQDGFVGVIRKTYRYKLTQFYN